MKAPGFGRGPGKCYGLTVTQPDVTGRFESALASIGAFFVNESPIQRTARSIARRLRDLEIDYAIAGALCLGAHGVVRATEDVDILISKEGLERFKGAWLGRGYVNIRPGGKAVRDTAEGVKVDFLLAGDFPGDGQPKPVCFPNPSLVRQVVGELAIVSLPRFIELKLASGMTAPHRIQDLADVLRLIEASKLARDFATSLDPYVRTKFDELWLAAQHPEDDY